jgi:hypothetical protein
VQEPSGTIGKYFCVLPFTVTVALPGAYPARFGVTVMV